MSYEVYDYSPGEVKTRINDTLASFANPHKMICCLDGPDAGTAHAMARKNVPKDNIHSPNTSEMAINGIKSQKVSTPFSMPYINFASNATVKYDIMYLDFCSTYVANYDNICKTFERRLINNNGVISFTFSSMRNFKSAQKLPKAPPKAYRKNNKMFYKNYVLENIKNIAEQNGYELILHEMISYCRNGETEIINTDNPRGGSMFNFIFMVRDTRPPGI